MNRWQQISLMIIVPALIVGGVIAGASLSSDDSTSTPSLSDASDAESYEYDYTIPAGTADRIEAGDRIEIVPSELEVEVGEAIRIVNDDDEGHVVGVFYVGAGETLTKEFTTPGELSGSCSIHSDGEFTLRVQA